MPTGQHSLALHSPRFPFAVGAIDPDHRLQEHEFTTDDLSAFLGALDQFYTPVATDGDAVPSQCVDGRSRQDGSYEPAPKAAAGTFAAVIGDALTTASHRPTGGNAAVHAKEVYTFLLEHGYKVGGHDADHAGTGGCGCGAEDNLERILAFTKDNGNAIRAFLQGVGVQVDDATHSLILDQVARLLTEAYVVPGAELRDVFISIAGATSVETLVGQHHEVALVINTEAGTTIDRAKLADVYGDRFQIFELDVPALQVAANALSLSAAEAQQKLAAMLYYNVATAAVLAGSSLRIAVR